MSSLEHALVAAARRAFVNPDAALFPTAKRHLVDCAGVALAGHAVPAVRALDQSVRASGRAVAPRDAALVTGMAAHFHDYDDDDPALSVGHPTVAVFAVLTALADTTQATVRHALAAYAAGVETTMRIGAIVNPGHYDAGFHATASLGIFGATMAAGLITGATDDELVHALALAASLSSGIKGNFGSDAKPLQVGAAAANAITAVDLARRGIRAAPGALFGASGFCTMHGGKNAVTVVDQFGTPWGLVKPGLNIKLYPCCSSTHTAVDALFEILGETQADAGAIEAIDGWIGPDVPAILIYDIPDDPLQGKFSLRYCLAAAAARGALDLDAFEADVFSSRPVRDMMARTHVHVDGTLPRIPTGVTHASRVRVTWRDGRTATRQVNDPLGSAARPLPDARLRDKFVRCATRSLGASQAENAFDKWQRASEASSFSDWLRTMRTTA